MLIKTKNFIQKLNSRLYQYTFNKQNPLVLKGSFKSAKYISDIDYTSYVYFNDKFLQILRNKLQRLKNFRFLYINAGMNENLTVPWVIDPVDGCDFSMKDTKKWLRRIKEIIPRKEYKSICKILKKDSLSIGDLIDVQEILSPLNTIRWNLDDVMKGTKVIDGKTYHLLEELKNDQEGPVINSIYIDGLKIVSFDIGIVDIRYRQPIWDRMYKYYTRDWYKILKSYKKLISKDCEQEYQDVMKTMEYINALKAQIHLVRNLIRYKPVSDDQIVYVTNQIHKDLQTVGIFYNNLIDVENTITIQLNTMAYPYVDYFLDKLTNFGKIKVMRLLRLVEMTKDPVPRGILMSRRRGGSKCPFLDTSVDNFITEVSKKLLYPREIIEKCIKEVSRDNKIDIREIPQLFQKHPIHRLFLQKYKNTIKVRGIFNIKDHNFLRTMKKHNGYYVIEQKDLENIRIYMLVG